IFHFALVSIFFTIIFVFLLFNLKPATLPNCSISSNTSFDEFFGSSRVITTSSAKALTLYSFCPIVIPFISLFCLIAFRRTSNTKINSSGDNGHPCLVPFSIFISSDTTLFIINFAFCSE
uniref:Uncharacterized protein n=1 Tax=Podarcis muralis TaxID=64176 RepID=A0A670IQA4_PODMU